MRDQAVDEKMGFAGRLHYNGLPAEGVSIGVSDAEDKRGHPSAETTVKSGPGGVFEIKSLVPGDYSLHLDFKVQPGWYRWGQISFDSPGVVHQDILVAEGDGAIIAGVVIDEASGQPFRRPPPPPDVLIDFYVALNNPDWQGQGVPAAVDRATGTFCLRGVPNMLFDLVLAGPGLHWKVLPSEVDARKCKIIDDIRLTVPPLGNLKISIAGFSDKELRKELKAEFEMAWGRSPGDKQFFKIDQSMAIPEGKGNVTFIHATLGSVVRSFDIKRGETFKIHLDREDFGSESDRPVSVNVILTQPDGSPIDGATLCFEKKLGYKLPGAGKQGYVVVTNANGRATIAEIDPGIWSVSCTPLPPENLTRLAKINSMSDLPELLGISLFHGIEIPRSPKSNFCIELALPTGAVRCQLVNKWTGSPLDDRDKVPRWIMVNDPNHTFRLEGITLAPSGSQFELKGIRDGRYKLTVAVFGFKQYMSDLFTIKEGEALDFGTVLLEPVGTMEIEVRDQAGKPIRFHADWEGKKGYASIYGLDSMPVSEAVTAYGNLPIGPLEVSVRAYGYKKETVTIEVERGRRNRASVVLKPLE